MAYQAINFRQKLGLFAQKWQPKVVAEMNDYQFKLVRIDGDFVWHDHEVQLLLIEPRGTVNTGDEGGERTAPNDVWI